MLLIGSTVLPAFAASTNDNIPYWFTIGASQKNGYSSPRDRTTTNTRNSWKVKKYSLGMKQRLNIAQAVFEKQNVILLDEPTNAIDDDGIQMIYKLIQKEKERGALIIIATHHEDDLRAMSDIILKMNKGLVRIKKSPSDNRWGVKLIYLTGRMILHQDI